MSLHLELAAMINDGFSSELQGPVECTQDAMVIRLANGVTLTVHYAAPDAYSMRWVHDGRIAGIDTAPLHREFDLSKPSSSQQRRNRTRSGYEPGRPS
jgi:hypothetical protein